MVFYPFISTKRCINTPIFKGSLKIQIFKKKAKFTIADFTIYNNLSIIIHRVFVNQGFGLGIQLLFIVTVCFDCGDSRTFQVEIKQKKPCIAGLFYCV